MEDARSIDRLLDLVERVTVVEKRDLVKAFLKRDEAGRQMGEMGFTQEEAQAAVTTLTDDEVLKVAEMIEKIPGQKALDQASGSVDKGDLAIILLLAILIFVNF